MPILSGQKLVTRDQRRKVNRSAHFFSGLRNRISNLQGFTLIELLIVVAIIGILSTIVLANYNSFGTRQEVKNAAGKLKSELRKYQNFAISGQKTPNPSDTDCQDTGILQYYAIALNSTEFRAYLLCDPAPALDLVPDHNYPWSGSVVVENFGYTGSVSGSCSGIVIFFKPVNENIDLWCGIGSVPPGADRVFIQLKDSNSTTRYRVYVTLAGEIYDERQP